MIVTHILRVHLLSKEILKKVSLPFLKNRQLITYFQKYSMKKRIFKNTVQNPFISGFVFYVSQLPAVNHCSEILNGKFQK